MANDYRANRNGQKGQGGPVLGVSTLRALYGLWRDGQAVLEVPTPEEARAQAEALRRVGIVTCIDLPANATPQDREAAQAVAAELGIEVREQ